MFELSNPGWEEDVAESATVVLYYNAHVHMGTARGPFSVSLTSILTVDKGDPSNPHVRKLMCTSCAVSLFEGTKFTVNIQWGVLHLLKRMIKTNRFWCVCMIVRYGNKVRTKRVTGV